jgi:hypothetical protein
MPRSLSLLTILLAVVLLAPSRSHAQQPTRADSAQARQAQQDAEMRQQMQQMPNMMSDMMRQVMQSTTAALAEPQTAQNLARFTRNYYTALVAQGFTEEQAMRIVANISFPMLPGR